MFTDFRNPLCSEVLDRRQVLKQEIVNLMRNPESILEQQDILFVEKYDNFLAIYLHYPLQDRKYQTVPLDCSLAEESRYLLFCYERNWEKEGYNQSTPVIELKDGRQVECGILDLNTFEETEKAILEKGFNEVVTIIEKEHATIEV